MTDQNPNPTQRMPLPEPTDGGTTATERSITPVPPAADPSPPADPPSPADPSPAAGEASTVPPAPAVAARARRDDRDHGRTASILFGLVILGIGLWFFVEHTLGYDLPDIRWSQLWPVALIGIGVWVVLGSMRRGSR